MSFADTADLASDPDYRRRLAACVFTEALGKPDYQFADQVLRQGPDWVAFCFGPTVASAPGFGDKYAAGGQTMITDGDLLSAVQASWDRIAAVNTPATS